MASKISRKAFKVAGLKQYFGSAKKAAQYRAARRNATIHWRCIIRMMSLRRDGYKRHLKTFRRRRPDGTHAARIVT
jgi:hypothetical protein